MKALILVDIQNDFVPGGALSVPRGDEVVAVANRLIPLFPYTIATQDWHPAHHTSFAANHPGRRVGEVIDIGGMRQILWPVHCVRETHGAALLAGLDRAGIHAIVTKGTDPDIDSYSAFFDNGHRKATDLAKRLRDNDIDEIFLMGLATDYCVKYSALDARQLGFRTLVVLDGCRGIDLAVGDVERSVAEMRGAGVEILDSSHFS